MCGRYSLKLDPSKHLKEAFPGIQFDSAFEFHANENVCPTANMPVVLNANAAPFCSLLRWGLIPSWSKEDKPFSGLHNARSETVDSKPSFKASFRRKRCVVPVDGFYEWKNMGPKARKIPYRFYMKSQPFLLMAGIWDEWERPAGLIRSFAILTTSANASVSEVHDRMPVILNTKQSEQWLIKNEDTSQFKSFFDPDKLPPLDREEFNGTKLAVRSNKT